MILINRHSSTLATREKSRYLGPILLAIPVDERAGGDPDPHAGQLEVHKDDVVADGVHGEEADEGAAVGVGLGLAQAALVGGEVGEEADDNHSLEQCIDETFFTITPQLYSAAHPLVRDVLLSVFWDIPLAGGPILQQPTAQVVTHNSQRK